MTELRETIAAEHKSLRDDAQRISQQVVDHAVFRVGQLMAGVLASVFVGIVALQLIAHRIFTARQKT